MAWRVQDGFFNGTPMAIAQTKNGYLWVGTANGLYQFDGVQFVRWNPGGKELQYASVYSLLGTDDRSLWIGMGTGLSRWADRKVTRYPGAITRINEIIEDQDRSIWIARSRIRDWSGPVCRVVGDRLHCYGKQDGLPTPYATSLTEDGSGKLWLGGSSTVFRWRPGSLQTYPLKGLERSEGLRGVSGVAIRSDDSFWIGMDHAGKGLGLQQLAGGQWKTFVTATFDSTKLAVSTLFLDRGANPTHSVC